MTIASQRILDAQNRGLLLAGREMVLVRKWSFGAYTLLDVRNLVLSFADSLSGNDPLLRNAHPLRFAAVKSKDSEERILAGWGLTGDKQLSDR
jgi:hypothetical protein